MLQSSTSLNLTAAQDWLLRGAPVLDDGGVLSWVNAAHPGYRYPEIAGLLLAFLNAQHDARDGASELRERVRSALLRDVEPHGAAGRNGQYYVFDTAIVYSVAPSQPLLDFIKRGVETRSPVRPPVPDHSRTWSTHYGSHLLKVAGVLAGAGCVSLATQLWEDLLPLAEGGRFRNHAGTEHTYLHAHCYAVQGLLDLTSHGFDGAKRLADAGGEWLALAQREDGGIPAWHDGATPQGPSRGDATAQAVKIWSDLDAPAFAREIAQGREFLAALQHPSGGLRYEPGSEDVNTWVTIFAAEAFS
jgi:hypothetical protein